MRRWIVGGTVVVAAAAAAAVASSSLGGSGDSGTSQAASQSTATTKIVKQDLVERETVDGTLGYSDARAVINRLSGTVTWTPRVGSVVETNHRLYEVDGEAVYLLDGAYPAYRTLQSGTKGDDVLALERNLRALALDTGHDMSVDGTWDSGTTAAVKRWQDRKGLTQTGSIEQGRIVFQPGARRIGDVELRAGESASGSAGSGGGNAPASAKNTAAVMQNAAATDEGEVVLQSAVMTEAVAVKAVRTQDATTPTTPSTTPPATTPRDNSPTPKPEASSANSTPQPASPGGSSAVPSQGRPAQGGGGSGLGGAAAPSSGGGGSAAAGAASGASSSASADVSSTLMTTTSVKRIVAVDLEATKQALAKRGAQVSVELPDGNDVDGTIATVSKVAQKKASASNDDPPATIKVVIKLKESAGTGLDQAPVDVSLEKTRAKDVLTVPVTALIARQGGSFAVEVRDGASRKIVEVETGLYTDSYVEIKGAGLAAGMTVTNARV